MQESATIRRPRPAVPAPPATPEASAGGGEAMLGLLLILGSAAFYFVWKSQAGLWKAAPAAAITYLVLLILAVALQNDLLQLPWPGLQKGAPAFLSTLVSLAAIGHFDFTAGTIAYEFGTVVLAAVMLWRLKQARGLRNLSLRNALKSFSNLVVLLGSTATLLSLYFPWAEPKNYQILVNNQVVPLKEVDPRFLSAMTMSYDSRSAFAVNYAMPMAGVLLALVVWSLLRRVPHTPTPGWYGYLPLLGAGLLTMWGMLLLNKNLGPYIFGVGVLVLVLGGLMAGIRGQLESVKQRYRTNG